MSEYYKLLLHNLIPVRRKPKSCLFSLTPPTLFCANPKLFLVFVGDFRAKISFLVGKGRFTFIYMYCHIPQLYVLQGQVLTFDAVFSHL